MRFQLPELMCLVSFLRGCKTVEICQNNKLFANFSASFFRRFSAAGEFPSPVSGHTKKGSPTKRNCPKTWKSFFVKLRDGKPCQKSTAAGVSGGSGNFLRNGRELVKVSDGERQVARLEELGQHLRHQVMTLEISRLFADVLTSDNS